MTRGKFANYASELKEIDRGIIHAGARWTAARDDVFGPGCMGVKWNCKAALFQWIEKSTYAMM